MKNVKQKQSIKNQQKRKSFNKRITTIENQIKQSRKANRGNQKRFKQKRQFISQNNRLSRNNSTNLRDTVSQVKTQVKRNLRKYGGSPNVPIVRRWNKHSELSTQWVEEQTHRGCSIVGSEFLEFISVSTTAAGTDLQTDPGSVLYNKPLSPLALDGTRLKLLAKLFQRYKVRQYEILIEPLIPATQNGAISGFVSYDPDLDLTSIPPGEEMQRVVLTMEDSKMWNVYEPVSIHWCADPNTEYWTRVADGAARLSIPGNLYLTSSSTYTGSAPSLTVAAVWLLYDVEFYNMGLLDSTPAFSPIEINIVSNAASNIFKGHTSGVTWVVGSEILIFADHITPHINYENGSVLICVLDENFTNLTTSINTPIMETIKADGVGFDKGRPFYLYPRIDQNGVRCYQMHSTITGALNADMDIVWSSDSALISTDLCNFRFTIQGCSLL